MEELMEIVERHHENETGFSRHYMMLYSVVLGMEAKNVFEFGSGFSSKAILLALEKTDGFLTSCDVRPMDVSCGKYFKDKSQLDRLSKRWEYLHKNSLTASKDILGMTFDVVLHDGSHNRDDVSKDLRMILPTVKKGGIVMVHDTAHPTDNYQLDEAIDNIDSRYAECGFEIDRVKLPYGYGLTIISIRRDYGNGEVNLTWKKNRV